MEVSPRTTFALYLERTATFPPFGTTFHHFLPLMCLSYNIFVEIASGFSEFTKIPDQKNAEFMRLSGFFSPAGGSWRAAGDLPLFPSFFLTVSGGNPVIKTSESGNLLVQARQPLAGFIAQKRDWVFFAAHRAVRKIHSLCLKNCLSFLLPLLRQRVTDRQLFLPLRNRCSVTSSGH